MKTITKTPHPFWVPVSSLWHKFRRAWIWFQCNHINGLAHYELSDNVTITTCAQCGRTWATHTMPHETLMDAQDRAIAQSDGMSREYYQ